MRTRQEIIDKLTELLNSRLVLADNNAVQGVFNYIPSNPSGISPFVAISARGSQRSNLASRRRQMHINVIIYIYVLYTHTVGDIDEAESWAAVNSIEQAIAETLEANTTLEGYWYGIEWPDYSSIDILVLDNQGYLLESILTRIAVT